MFGIQPDKKMGLSSLFALSKASCPHGYLQEKLGEFACAFCLHTRRVSARFLTSPLDCEHVVAGRETAHRPTCWCACEWRQRGRYLLMPCLEMERCCKKRKKEGNILVTNFCWIKGLVGRFFFMALQYWKVLPITLLKKKKTREI